jgi:hypothetical protein
MSNYGSQFPESKFPSSTTLSQDISMKAIDDSAEREFGAKPMRDIPSVSSTPDDSAMRAFGPNATYRSVAKVGGSEMMDGGAQVRLVSGAQFSKPDLSPTQEGVAAVGMLKSFSGDSGGPPSLSEKLGSSDARIHVQAEESMEDRDVSELPVLPMYLKSKPSCIARLPPREMFAQLDKVLPGLNGFTVELRPAKDKLKLKGQCYKGGSQMSFLITLFRNDRRDVVVLCEKQDGCSLLFSSFFRALLTGLGETIVSQGDTSQPPTFVCPSNFRSSEVPLVLDPYLHRARSDFLDVKKEAAAALVDLSQGATRTGLLEHYGELFAVIETFLFAENEELHRLGGVLLKNLLELNRDLASKIPQSLINRMRALLGYPSHYLNKDSKRQIEGALRIIDDHSKRQRV